VKIDKICCRLDTTPECGGQTDGRTDRRSCHGYDAICMLTRVNFAVAGNDRVSL